MAAAALAPILMEFGKDAAAYIGAWGAKKLFDKGVDLFTSKPKPDSDAANKAQAAFIAASMGAAHLKPKSPKALIQESMYLNTPQISLDKIAQGDAFSHHQEAKSLSKPDFKTQHFRPVRVPASFRSNDYQEGPSARQSQYGYTTAAPEINKRVPAIRKPLALNHGGTIPRKMMTKKHR